MLIDMQVGSMGGMALVRNIKGVAMTGEAPNAPILLLLDRSADEFPRQAVGSRCLVDEAVHLPGPGRGTGLGRPYRCGPGLKSDVADSSDPHSAVATRAPVGVPRRGQIPS